MSKEELSTESLVARAGELLVEANELTRRLTDYEHDHPRVDGIGRFVRRVDAERTFLQSIVDGQVIPKQAHIDCTNIPYFAAVTRSLETEADVVAVFKCVHTRDPKYSGNRRKVDVEIVSAHGLRWIKIKTTKADSIRAAFLGQAQVGSKSIESVAEALKLCAQDNPLNYSFPEIIFDFTHGVTADVAKFLRKMGIHIRGEIIPVTDDEDSDDENSDSDNDLASKADLIENESAAFSSSHHEDAHDANLADLGLGSSLFPPSSSPSSLYDLPLFLDVSTMLALCSGVVHGGYERDYKDPLIQMQAVGERECPTLPILEEFMKDREIFICETARDRFTSIFTEVGGPQERSRARELMQRVTVLPDQPSERALRLTLGPKIKDQHIKVFGTTDYHKGVTMTSNQSFVRIAQDNGIPFTVFMHAARALTEEKALEELRAHEELS